VASRAPGVALLIALVSCASPIRPEFDASPTAAFGRYASYAWISDSPLIGPSSGVGGPRYVSPIDEQRIRRSVDAELVARGYQKASPEAADLIVSFAVGSQEKVRVEEVPGRSTVMVRGYGYGSWYDTSPVRVRTYTEGTLALEFFDRATREAVWVGWGSKRLSSADEPDELIRRAVAMILEPFPSRL
jgi:hypothetical protein